MPVEFAQVAERQESSVGEEQHVIGEATELIGVVRDPHDRHAAVGDLTTQILDGPAGFAVERSGGFVGEQHLRPRQERAGDRHALGLTNAQSVGWPVEQFDGQRDVFEHVAGSFLGHIGVGDLEVVEHGPAEHRRLLEHHADVASQRGRIPVTKVTPFEGDFAGDRIVEAVEEPEKCRLASTGGACDREDPLDRDRHVDVAQYRLVGRAGADAREFERRRVRVAAFGWLVRIGGHERNVVVPRRQTVDVRGSEGATGRPAVSAWWRSIIALIAVLAPWAASTAFAHSGLIAASPGPGETVGGDVSTIQLFYGDIIVSFDATITRQADGELLEAEAVMTSEITGELRLAEPLSEPGEYAVRHTVLSIDDDVVEAAYLFSYEPDAPEPILVFLPDDDEGGLAWWAWTIIGVGAVVIIVLVVRLILSIRRARATATSNTPS